MIHQVGNLCSQARVVPRHRRQGGLHPLFADLLRALLDAPGEKAVRVRPRLGMGFPRGDDPCFLLESVEGGARVARWSFLGTAPERSFSGADGNPFDLLRGIVRSETRALPASDGFGDDLPPFTGGAVGFAGYDAVRRLERLPSTNPDPVGLPDAWFGVFETVLAFDHVRHRLLFLGHARPGEETAVKTRLATLAARVTGPWEESLPRKAFVDRVERAKEHIRAGDVFQVVLSRRWSAAVDGDTFSIYRALRRVSPSPYQYYLRTPDAVIFGAPVSVPAGKVAASASTASFPSASFPVTRVARCIT